MEHSASMTIAAEGGQEIPKQAAEAEKPGAVVFGLSPTTANFGRNSFYSPLKPALEEITKLAEGPSSNSANTANPNLTARKPSPRPMSPVISLIIKTSEF